MFDYKKYYVFSIDRYIADRFNDDKPSLEILHACQTWAYKIDGKYVEYFNKNVGLCNGYYVYFDWCIEVDPYDM